MSASRSAGRNRVSPPMWIGWRSPRLTMRRAVDLETASAAQTSPSVSSEGAPCRAIRARLSDARVNFGRVALSTRGRDDDGLGLPHRGPGQTECLRPVEQRGGETAGLGVSPVAMAPDSGGRGGSAAGATVHVFELRHRRRPAPSETERVRERTRHKRLGGPHPDRAGVAPQGAPLPGARPVRPGARPVRP